MEGGVREGETKREGERVEETDVRGCEGGGKEKGERRVTQGGERKKQWMGGEWERDMRERCSWGMRKEREREKNRKREKSEDVMEGGKKGRQGARQGSEGQERGVKTRERGERGEKRRD